MECEKWKKFYFADEEEIPKVIEVWIKENDKEGDTEPFDLDKEHFAKQYSKYYFEGKQDQREPEGINKSSECIEQIIEELLKQKEWNDEDVFNLIAWKTGAIRHAESKAEKIKYTDGSNKEAFIIQPPAPATRISLDEAFRKSIIECRTKYVEEKGTDEKLGEKIWEELLEKGKEVRGIGTVYLVTLFSFITGGEYPVYDRFAMAALVALKMNKNGIVVPTVSTQGNRSKEAIITGWELPEKTSTKAKDLLEDNSMYRKYIGLLNEFFDEGWKTNRGIDQALWVYGHYFNVK